MKTLIGDVPDDWSCRPLTEVCQLQSGPSGTSIRRAAVDGKGVPVILPRNLHAGRIVGEFIRVAAESAETLGRYGLRAGDVLCTRVGELGVRAFVSDDQRGWLFGTGLLRLRPAELLRARYLSHYLTLPPVREWIVRRSTGTAVPALSTEGFGRLPVVLPPLPIQESIGEALDLLDQQVIAHDEASQTAARLRDALAPLLMTGAKSLT